MIPKISTPPAPPVLLLWLCSSYFGEREVIYSHESFKSRVSSHCRHKVGVILRVREREWTSLIWRKGHLGRKAGGLRSWEAPSWPPTREWGPQSYNPTELRSANNQNEPGSGFFPRASQLEPSLTHTLMLAFWCLKHRTQSSLLGSLTYVTERW